MRLGLLLMVSACAALPPRGEAVADRAVLPPPWVWRVDPEAAEVELRATVVAGSARDPAGREGLAALAAAVTQGDADVALDVGRDLVEIALRCPAADRVRCGERFLAALTAVPDAEALEIGRAALAAVPEDPEDWLWRSVYEGHPYGHVPTGRAELWPLLTLDEVVAYRARWWTRMQTQVGARGPWLPEEQQALEDALRAMSARPVPDHPQMRPVQATHTRLLRVVTADADQPTTAVAGLALGTELERGEAVALALGLAALGPLGGEDGPQASSSPLLGVGSLSHEPTLRHPLVLLEGWAATPEELRERLASLGAGLLGPESVARVTAARAAWLAELEALDAPTSQALADTLRGRALGVTPRELGDHLRGVSVAAVELALRTHLVADRLHVVVVGPDAGAWHLPPGAEGAAPDERTLTLR